MLSFANSPGNLFNRIGKLGLLLKQFRTYQAAQQPNMIDTTNGVVAQYNAESDIQALMGSSYISLLDAGASSIYSIAAQIATATVNRMVFRDNPRISQTLTSLNLIDSLKEVIRQMRLQGASVRACSITTSPGSFTGVGNASVNASAYRPGDGLVLENAYSETLLFTCASDSYSGGSVAGNESVTVTSIGNIPDTYSWQWPLGSNVSRSISVIDGNSDNSAGNLLTNSGFEDWTSNVPDKFTLVAGAGGSTVFQETSITYDTSYALRFVGDGSTLVELTQAFDDSTNGTAGTLDQYSQYSGCVFLRRDGLVPSQGVLEFALVDGSDQIILDANNNSNSYTVDMTQLTTVYTAYRFAFRTPQILPSTVKLRIKQTTALANGRAVYMDKLSFGLMTQLYTSGPYLAVHAGSNPLGIGDYATCTITNSRGSGGSLDTFQTLFARLFPSEFIQGGLLLPSSSSPTISDSLIG